VTARRTQRIPAAQRKRRQIKLTLAPDVVAILAAMPGRASRYVDDAVRAYASIPSRRANSR
jgi:hypothetical protein